jgi:hypothetical protein
MAGRIAGSAMKSIMMRMEGMTLRMNSPGLRSCWQQAGLWRFGFEEDAIHGLPPDEITFCKAVYFFSRLQGFYAPIIHSCKLLYTTTEELYKGLNCQTYIFRPFVKDDMTDVRY